MIVKNKSFEYLIDKKPCCEEESNSEKDDGEMRKHGRVDGGNITSHGGNIEHGHPDVLFMIDLKHSKHIKCVK